MTLTEPELRDRLATVEDPQLEEDIVTLGLVNDVAIRDGTATVSLAFNAPYAPSEIEIGNGIRDEIDAAGLEPDLHASVGAEHGFDEEIMPGVRNVIAVASGKGGVGKTTVAANLAAGLNDRGARVGILDADVHGPNVPRILPTENEPGATPNGEIVPPRSDGVMVMSTDHMMPDDDQPAVLRGPMVNNVMMKFVNEVEWGQLDYLIVDLPPGTGDASLNLLQTLPVAGVVIVTTPQEMAVADARKGLRLFADQDAPVLGVVENMSAFHCPNCEDTHAVFGEGGDGGDRSYLDEEPDYGGWLDDANNYDEGTVDMTDQDAVTITVGYESTAFDPAAVAVSSGTEVTWEWNGQGGSHDVVSQDDGPLESESSDEEGHMYSYTFEESGTYNYSCTPHEAMGMKGAVYVE